jgi:8-oxo-dGTP diphosphatase
MTSKKRKEDINQILEEENEKKMVDVASAVIITDGKVLLIKRSSAHKLEPDKWQLPEGKVDEGETEGEALVREVNEEIGRKVLSSKFYKKFPFQVPYEGSIYNVYRFVYETTIDEGDIVLSEEHTEFRWVNLKDVVNMDDLYVGTKQIIEEFILQ